MAHHRRAHEHAIVVGGSALVTYVGEVNPEPRRRTALGAAVVGVLLVLSTGLGLALAPTSALAVAARTTASSSAASVATASSHATPSTLRAVHPAAARAASVDRYVGGAGAAVLATALLVLALLVVVAAVTTVCRRWSSRTRGVSGPRAPPALAVC
jgi:hypothetical protein